LFSVKHGSPFTSGDYIIPFGDITLESKVSRLWLQNQAIFHSFQK